MRCQLTNEEGEKSPVRKREVMSLLGGRRRGKRTEDVREKVNIELTRMGMGQERAREKS